MSVNRIPYTIVNYKMVQARRCHSNAYMNSGSDDIDEVHYWTTTKLHGFISRQFKELNPELQKKIKVFSLPSEVNE